MSRKISLQIGGRSFDIDVEENFSYFIESQMVKDFNGDGSNNLKELLQAYIGKTYELYTQEQTIEKILKKLVGKSDEK